MASSDSGSKVPAPAAVPDSLPSANDAWNNPANWVKVFGHRVLYHAPIDDRVIVPKAPLKVGSVSASVCLGHWRALSPTRSCLLHTSQKLFCELARVVQTRCLALPLCSFVPYQRLQCASLLIASHCQINTADGSHNDLLLHDAPHANTGQVDVPMGWTFNFAHTESHIAVMLIVATAWHLGRRLGR